MKVLVRKCRFTGKLFELKDNKKYAKHLKEVRVKMREERKHAKIRDTFSEWLRGEKAKITHPEMIPEWFMENQLTIMEAHNAGIRPAHVRFGSSNKFFVSTDKFIDVKYERRPDFRDLLSNTHACPDNGKMNFGGDVPNTPRGYPGWKTYIQGTLVRDKKNDCSYPYSAALNLVGIKTGSGGGGNKNWGYDCSIFLADWPGLNTAYQEILEERHQEEEREIIRRLKGRR